MQRIVSFLALASLTVLLCGCSQVSQRDTTVGPMTEAAFGYASASAAGVGLDPSQDFLRSYPMAFAVYASAASIAASNNQQSNYRQAAITAALWLIEHHDLNGDGRTGWGLPFAWDASQDGSVNPARTVYGITTALAVKALLDVYDLAGVEECLATAEAALEAYLPYFTKVEEGQGYVWYSQWPEDANPFPNVISMLAGVYARAASMLGRNDFRERALACARYVAANVIRNSSGEYWKYRIGRTKINDAVHAAYIVEGLMMVSKYADFPFDTQAALDYLGAFSDGIRIRRFVTDASTSARSWGVGYLMYVLCLGGRCEEEARKILPALEAYEFAPGQYGLFPGESSLFPRLQTHVLIGLAQCGF